MRRERAVAALRMRVRRIAAHQDPSLALRPRACYEERRVSRLLDADPDDHDARSVLGWLAWYRHRALSGSEAHLAYAFRLLMPCFVAGHRDLPEALLPSLARATVPRAIRALERMQAAPSPERAQAAARLWLPVAEATPADDPDRPMVLSNLAMALGGRWEQSGAAADIHAAVEAGRQAVHAVPAGHPDRPAMLSNLALGLNGLFSVTGAVDDAEAALDAVKQALAETPPGDPRRQTYLSQFAALLRQACLADLHDRFRRIEETGDPAPALERRALDGAARLLDILSADDDERKPELRMAIGLLHWYRYRALPPEQSEPDLRRAMHWLTPCFIAGMDGLPQHVLPYLAEAARPQAYELLQHKGPVDQVTTTAALWQRIADATPAEHPARATVLAALGVALRHRFEATGDLADLDAAVDCCREGLDGMLAELPADDPAAVGALANLGLALDTRFEWTGRAGDSDEAIGALRRVLTLLPADDPDRPRHTADLGTALHTRVRTTGAGAGLGEALVLLRQAVDTAPDDAPYLAEIWSHLGLAQRTRYQETNALADVDASVTSLRRAVEEASDDAPDLAFYLANAAIALRDRFAHTGALADLDDAAVHQQRALRLTPAGDVRRAMHLAHLGAIHHDRFLRGREPADLDASVRYLRDAVEATPKGHPSRSRYLAHLGTVLSTRYRETDNARDGDLRTAVGLLRQAVRNTSEDHSQRSGHLTNLAIALDALHEDTGDTAHLDEAVDCFAQALAESRHPAERDSARLRLGTALHRRFEVSHDTADRDKALALWTTTWRSETATPRTRISAAIGAAALLRESDIGQAADAAEGAVRLLPHSLSHRMERADQYHVLSRHPGLVGDAVAFCLADPRSPHEERAVRALRLLETGRATLLSQALETRGDLSDLRRLHPRLAERYAELSRRLNQPPGSFGSAGQDMPARAPRPVPRPRNPPQDRHDVARDFHETLATIRAQPGFSRFGAPPTTDELLAEAFEGPLVVFNVSEWASHALLLTTDGITGLPLPRLSVTSVLEQSTTFREALVTATTHRDHARRVAAQQSVVRSLEWLWDAATGPVLEALGHHGPPPPGQDLPRVWWVPGGLLGRLPLHAAGHHTGPGAPHRTVMDRVLSSYTPTVRALRHARDTVRRQESAAPGPLRAVVVTMPTTPGATGRGRLDHVEDEAAALRARLPHHVHLREPDPGDGGPPPDGTLPTKANVVARLADSHIAHFACHGESHATDPSRSLLFLHDHDEDPFTVAGLGPLRLERAQLAYLSACRTAAFDTSELLDEAIHLASAFQLAGYPHVVGTLWEINDEIAVDVADRFYAGLVTADGRIDTRRSAQALHEAVREVRDAFPHIPSLWAAYLHAGA
ncbi:CHAT domain-containing protein [Streptomyces albus]|uniref:CHAT domain-containing protein n=1 Tax=Streptomyces albus TaxID=1888 RepID=UPI000AAA3CCC|nr:CHAT domain-containing protein [Streptomyces albus]